MAETYSGDPRDSLKDAVRFLLGATKAPWLFTDEEILYALETQGGIYNAAAELAMIKSTEYTDKKDKSVGPLSIKYGEIGNRWLYLSHNLRQRAGRHGATVVMTQVPRKPHVTLGMHDISPATLPEILSGEENP